jgi:hypothetical protein
MTTVVHTPIEDSIFAAALIGILVYSAWSIIQACWTGSINVGWRGAETVLRSDEPGRFWRATAWRVARLVIVGPVVAIFLIALLNSYRR